MTKQKKVTEPEVDETEQDRLIEELADILVEGFLWQQEHKDKTTEEDQGR